MNQAREKGIADCFPTAGFWAPDQPGDVAGTSEVAGALAGHVETSAGTPSRTTPFTPDLLRQARTRVVVAANES